MEEILSPFAYEFANDMDIFMNDENVDFGELSSIFETKFQSRFPNVKVLVVPQYISMSDFDIHIQKKVYIATQVCRAIHKDKTVVMIFLGILNGALLAHPDHRPSFSKEWTCLSRRSIMIQYADNTHAHAICPYDDKKSYDVNAAITSVQHFLDEEVQCTCCLSNIHEVRKKILHCVQCSTFLCRDCYYKCKVNKTNECITCKQNFSLKIKKTRQDQNIKIKSIKFGNFSKSTPKTPKAEDTCHISVDDIRNMVAAEAQLNLYETKAEEFRKKLREKYGQDLLILVPRPCGKVGNTEDVLKRIQVILRTMYVSKTNVVAILLGAIWGANLSSSQAISKALFLELKGANAFSRCTVLIKDATNDISYIYKGLLENDPYNVDNILEDIVRMKLKL